jgi:DnaJ like chaperone protein
MAKLIVIVIIGLFVYAILQAFRKKDPDGKATGNNTSSGQNTNYGKWIGGGLGWAFGGPLGAILGFALGSMFTGSKGLSNPYQGSARGDFAMSLLVLSAAVMKADGKVVKSELDYVKNFFLSQFGSEESERLILMLKNILNQEINVQEVSAQIGQYMDYPSKLQLIHYLFGIASADGQYHESEVNVIDQISGFMGVRVADFASIRAMFVKNINSAYDILEILPDATNEEVKKAYRRLAVEYHPDKVSHLGEDIHKSATEKFQTLNAAYEQIKKQRGIN